jgi:hypothetical protein
MMPNNDDLKIAILKAIKEDPHFKTCLVTLLSDEISEHLYLQVETTDQISDYSTSVITDVEIGGNSYSKNNYYSAKNHLYDLITTHSNVFWNKIYSQNRKQERITRINYREIFAPLLTDENLFNYDTKLKIDKIAEELLMELESIQSVSAKSLNVLDDNGDTYFVKLIKDFNILKFIG